jgi:putative transposase
MEYRTGRHVVYSLHAHLVFVTKYRRKVLNVEAIEILEPIFAKICQDFGGSLVECDGEDDHIHLLVLYPPHVALSKLVNSLKGVSSRLLRQQLENIRKRYWKGVLWSPSYFVASCGGAPLAIIAEYVKNQRAGVSSSALTPRFPRKGK